MSSQRRTPPDSNPGPQMNTEPFNSTNPFAESSDEAESTAENPAVSDHGNTTDTRRKRSGKSESNSESDSTSGSHGQEKVKSHDESLMEKIKTATDETGPAIVEKIKTAAAAKFHLQSIRATGPAKGFNPTTVRAHIRFKDPEGHDGSTASKPHGGPDGRQDVNLLWRARDNRKGRNSVAVPHSVLEKVESSHPFRFSPELKASLKDVGTNIFKMFTTFPYWDMAFWSGWSYTVGSALFVADGALAFSLEVNEDLEFAGEEKYAIPLCFFLGAIFYQIGAVMAYLEAVNDGSFHGSSMRRLLDGHGEEQKKLLDEKLHGFFGHFVPHLHKHRREEEADALANSVDPEAGWKTKERHERPGSLYPTGKAPAPRRGGMDLGEAEEGETTTYLTWRWWPSWKALRTHHVYEIGYLACAIQLFGVTLYGVTSVIVFPSILGSFNKWQTYGGYYIPQAVAAACFLIASIMFMLETQEKWWKPELKVLGWWIGFWATVGSVGFELIAAFGFPAWSQHWAAYQSELSSTWGSFAYLIASALQWYEAINKRPVAEIFNEPGEMKSYMVHPI